MKYENRQGFVNVAVFDDYIDANMTRAELEVYGIKSYLVEENRANMYPVANLRMTKIFMSVHENDREEAVALLDKLRKGEVPGEE